MPELANSNNLDLLRELSKYHTETESVLSSFWLFSPNINCIAKDGVLLKVNPAWTAVLGYEEDELLGTKFLDYIHPDDIIETKKTEQRLAQGIPAIEFINRFKHKLTGEWVYLEWSARQDPYSCLLFASATDKTEAINNKKQLIDALEKEKTLTETLAKTLTSSNAELKN
jgi:PAS domain S-box-containing protein